MSVSVNVKKENILVAIELLSSLDVMYKIKEGFIFGKPCYWIEFFGLVSIDHLLLLKDLAQDDE